MEKEEKKEKYNSKIEKYMYRFLSELTKAYGNNNIDVLRSAYIIGILQALYFKRNYYSICHDAIGFHLLKRCRWH